MMKKNIISINFIYQTTYQILLVISPLITAPYIARILGPANNGIFSYTHAIANYFVVFAALGIEAYGNRSIAQARIKGKKELDRTFSSIFLMHFVVAVLVNIIYVIYVLFIASKYKSISLIQGIWVLSSIFDINWLFFGLEEFKLTVTRNIMIKFILIFSVFIFVKTVDDLWKYTLIMVSGTFISNLVLWFFVKKYVNLIKVPMREALIHLRPLFILFLAVIATSIYRMIDKVMLGNIVKIENLGAYEYADKMLRLVVSIITALGTVMLPRMSALYAENNYQLADRYIMGSSQFLFIMAFWLAFGLGGVADEFMPILLGKGYSSSIILIKILSISIPIMGWNNLIRTQILMPKHKDKVYMIAVWAGAIINVIMNYFLIRALGTIGAAISTVIAYGVVCLFQTFPIRKEIKISRHFSHIIFPFISGIIMYFLIRKIGSLFGRSILCVITEIIVGSVVYLVLIFIYLYKSNNEIFTKYYQNLKKFIKRKHKFN